MAEAKPLDRWLNEAVDHLLDLTSSGIEPPVGGFVARPWTLLKLAALHYYLPIYFNILRSRYRRLVYVDLFGGSGVSPYSDGGLTTVVPGSALVAASRRKQSAGNGCFDEIICVEKDPARLLSLRDVLAGCGYREGVDLHLLKGDCNSHAAAIVKRLKPYGTHALVLSDPENLEPAWSTLATIIQGHPALDLFAVHLVVGSSRKENVAAKVRYYRTDAWKNCKGRDELAEMYLKDIQSLRPDSIGYRIPIQGGGDVGEYWYDLVFSVRRTKGNSPFTQTMKKLQGNMSRVDGQMVRRILRTRFPSKRGLHPTRQTRLALDDDVAKGEA